MLEETGLEVGNVKFLVATNDVMEGEDKHYITIFVTCEIVGENRVPLVSLLFMSCHVLLFSIVLLKDVLE